MIVSPMMMIMMMKRSVNAASLVVDERAIHRTETETDTELLMNLAAPAKLQILKNPMAIPRLNRQTVGATEVNLRRACDTPTAGASKLEMS